MHSKLMFGRLHHPFVKDNRSFEQLGHPYYGIPWNYFSVEADIVDGSRDGQPLTSINIEKLSVRVR